LELLASTPELTLIWAKVTYLFITTAPVAFFLFATHFFWKDKWLRPKLIPILFIIPAITNLMLWVPNFTSLIWREIAFKIVTPRFLILQIVQYGNWFWVNSIYIYTLTFISMILMLIFIFRSSTLYRQQSLWILLSIVFPAVFNIVYIFRLIPWLQKDFTPISFSLSGIMVSMGIFRYRLFDLTPMARDVIIDKISDGFIISDRFDRIVDMNPAAAQIFQVEVENILGKQTHTLLSDWDKISDQNTLEQFDYTIQTEENGQTFHHELKVSKLQNKRNLYLGKIVLLRDVTERVQLLEEVQQLAMQDSLTKIFNRRHFFELAQRILSQSIRYHWPVSLLIMDIDHFKSINDTYGHSVGDHVLQRFAALCAGNLRQSDIFARFGGEEFIILMPETAEKNAAMAARRLLKQIAETPIEWKDQQFSITVSIGAASLNAGAAPIRLDALIEKADQALYAAKQNGRNQVAFASEIME
ncbi:MAG TPA: diguanylate cyclase, partial [Anaerolineales bacterium]|nr:diguanylate cyclase [Anaerolineales bacterium]